MSSASLPGFGSVPISAHAPLPTTRATRPAAVATAGASHDPRASRMTSALRLAPPGSRLATHRFTSPFSLGSHGSIAVSISTVVPAPRRTRSVGSSNASSPTTSTTSAAAASRASSGAADPVASSLRRLGLGLAHTRPTCPRTHPHISTPPRTSHRTSPQCRPRTSRRDRVRDLLRLIPHHDSFGDSHCLRDDHLGSSP